jgi:hypothetical protein
VNRAARLTAGVLTGALLAGAVAGLSRVPWTAERSDQAVLRLAWRYRSRLVSACRPIPPEEQARQPVHMRRTEECTRALLPYRLTVSTDGAALLRDSIAAGGARADRPLSLFREVRLPAGEHGLRIRFAPYGAGTALELDTVLVLAPRQVAVVTIGEGGLVIRGR